MAAPTHPGPHDPRARAQALRSRAVAAINRACGLVASATITHARCRETRARRAAPGPAPVPPAPARQSAPRRAPHFRVVRPGAPHRRAAAHEDGRASSWAQAPVLHERVVFDETGARWTVRELDAATLPGSRGERCLVFENSSVVRRVWHFPEAWSELDADDLLRMGREVT